MPCLLLIAILAFPRLVLAVLFFFSNYLERAYHGFLLPLLGFLFLPLTTLAYAFAMHYGGMQWTPIGTATVVTAVLVDLGLFRTSSRRREGGTREITVRGEKVG